MTRLAASGSERNKRTSIALAPLAAKRINAPF